MTEIAKTLSAEDLHNLANDLDRVTGVRSSIVLDIQEIAREMEPSRITLPLDLRHDIKDALNGEVCNMRKIVSRLERIANGGGD